MIELISLALLLISLHSIWSPHIGQIPIGRAIFYEGFKKIFVCCGRSFGKSQLAAYITVRIALEYPNTTNYIFAPFIGQAKEIYWTPKLLHKLIPDEMIESANSTEMRITLTNGSMIKVCGADNYEAYRGVKLSPNSICVIEETKDVKKEFLDAFLPNLSVNDPILLMIGTPPYKENHFIDYMKHAQSDPSWFYYHAKTEVNPYVSKDFLEQQKAFLIANGMEDVWLSEYEATFTLGGHRSVFPMIAKAGSSILDDIWPKDSNKWTLWVGLDPASSSTFGVIFFLMNPFTRKVIAVDEIHETRPDFMSARKMFVAVNEKVDALKKRGIKEVNYVYDNAARWFKTEINDIDKDGSWWLTPCDKSSGLQGEISAWRGVVAHGLFTFTNKSKELKRELDNYILDEKGRLPDKEDDLMQAGAYALRAMGFDYHENLEPKPIDKVERRGYALSDEFQENEYKELD